MRALEIGHGFENPAERGSRQIRRWRSARSSRNHTDHDGQSAYQTKRDDPSAPARPPPPSSSRSATISPARTKRSTATRRRAAVPTSCRASRRSSAASPACGSGTSARRASSAQRPYASRSPETRRPRASLTLALCPAPRVGRPLALRGRGFGQSPRPPLRSVHALHLAPWLQAGAASGPARPTLRGERESRPGTGPRTEAGQRCRARKRFT